MPPRFMTPDPSGPPKASTRQTSGPLAAAAAPYPSYDYEADQVVPSSQDHRTPTTSGPSQGRFPSNSFHVAAEQPAYPPLPPSSSQDHYNHPPPRRPTQDRNVSESSLRSNSDPFHNQQQQQQQGTGGIIMRQSQDEYDSSDYPLLPPGAAPYGYAPASSFDADGRLITGAGGISPWPDQDMGMYGHVDEGNYIDGQARGRLVKDGDDDYDDPYSVADDHQQQQQGGYGQQQTGYSGNVGWAPNSGAAEAGNMGGIRYGHIPQRVPRRYKTLKRVELYHGNLVLDCPVPSRLLERLNDRESREFTHMRYTAATCDPDSFKDERYTLRQVLFDPPRRTELMIVLTMYNEDEQLFCRTLHGVMTNIAHLCSRTRSKTWGDDGWKKVVIVIVSDGRLKINARVLAVLAAMGVYQEGVGKNVVNGKPVTAHIYEYTTQLSVDPDLKFRGREKGIMPVQILFCLKERNQKKINSHRWFFNAFGSILQPNVCVLLDVGTMPRAKSIYHLWKAFDINSNVAGACGEIVALKGKMWTGLLNPLVAAQNFEYKMSNILDKPLESVFGYITVLPGAFSAYRYIALQNDALGQGPLCSYFKGETLHGGATDADIFTSNMYLAEDRILCWELVSKRDSSWILHYVKSAQAVTDVPDSVPELISQRRRWLNGSFFAGIHSIVKFGYIYRSSHSFGRKLALHIELLYQTIQLFFSWFGMANFFIAFSILSSALADQVTQMRIPGIVLSYLYVALIMYNFLLAMGNRPAGSKWAYTISMVIFALLTIYMTAAAIYLAVVSITVVQDSSSSVQDLLTNRVFVNVVISSVATFGVYTLASVLFLDPWHMVTSLLQYVLLAPTFVNILTIYAFANIHDVSWGTKGSDTVSTDLGVVVAGQGANKDQVEVALPTDAKDLDSNYTDAIHVLSTKPVKESRPIDAEQRQRDYYQGMRTRIVTVWALSNGGLGIAILHIGSNNVRLIYMGFLLYSVAVLAVFRLLGSIVYLIKRLLSGE